MKISQTAIRRPVATIMVALALILFGIISLFRMNVDLFPNVTLPMVVVATVYPGAGPQEVESEVTSVLEERLGTVPNLKEITSRSSEGISVIMLQLEWGTNLDAATSDIRDRLDMAEVFLPTNAQKPFLFKFDVSMMPVINITLSGDMSLLELTDLAEDISTQLQRIEGVAAVGIAGARKPQVQLNIDMNQMAQYNITFDQIALSLKSQNINFPVGSVETKDQKYLVRVLGQYENLDQIKNTVIGTKGTTPILLRQIADVQWKPEEKEDWTRLNQKNAIFMWVQRRPDANTITVTDKVKKEMQKISSRLPSSVKFEIFWDSSESIKRSIQNVLSNLLFGGILAIFVLYLFLRRLRATLIVAFAIPISIFFALFFMYLAGFTVNILSMAGLAIAVGMVVDNGIVVFESIYRHREQGEEPLIAADTGTSEVGMAITASTLTTLAVFFPLLLVQGLIRVFFKELSWAIIFSLSASLGVALTIVPMLTRYIRVGDEGRGNGDEGRGNGDEGRGNRDKGRGNGDEGAQIENAKSGMRNWKRVEQVYGSIINWALRHRKLLILGTLGLFIISIAMIPFMNTEFMPEQTMRYTELTAEMPRGTNIKKTEDAVTRLEKYILEKWHNEIQGVVIRGGSGASIYQEIFGQTGSNNAEIDILFKKNARHKIKQIEDDIRKYATQIPGLVVRLTERRQSAFLGTGAPVQIEIIGHNLKTADSLNELIMAKVKEIPGIVDLQSTYKKGESEIQLIIDRNRSIRYGLTPYQIGSILRTQLQGNVASVYRIRGKEYDMILRLKSDQRKDINALLSTILNTQMGNVLLKNIATIKTTTSPLQINHKNTERIITITGNIIGVSSGKIGQEIKRRLSQITPPSGFEIRVAGSYQEMINTFKDIGFAILIAIILVFMVMAGQFESFKDPFVILFTIPLALIGVIWALIITQTALSIISGIGVLVLVGIVVNNGIVYIDYVNQLRRKMGMELQSAVLTAGKVRLRPILMTALTTIFGLLPLALKIGEGSELWSPLARAVIGGMLVSTFLTLIFIPTLYTTMEMRNAEREMRNGK